MAGKLRISIEGTDVRKPSTNYGPSTQLSAEGVEAELRGIYRYKSLAVSLGVNTVSFSFVEVNGAVGLFLK